MTFSVQLCVFLFVHKTETGTDIEWAAQLLQSSELVAIPTETVYGLAANGLDEEAVKKIFTVKKRPLSNPLILHFKDIESMVEFTGELSPSAHRLAQHFWPGPMTLLLDRREQIPGIVNAGKKRVAVRIPMHPLLLKLLKSVHFPIAAPSANLYGRVSPTKAEHVAKEFDGSIPYILNGGPSSKGIESTIVGFENDKVVVYRLGAIPVEDIESCIGKEVEIQIHKEDSASPVASGMVEFHYAPQTPIYPIEKLNEALDTKNCGYIGFHEIHPSFATENQFLLSPEENLGEVSRNLYDAMHFMDSRSFDHIYICQFPDRGLGKSINDRIKRAVAKFKT